MNNGRKFTKIMLKCDQFIHELIENMIKKKRKERIMMIAMSGMLLSTIRYYVSPVILP